MEKMTLLGIATASEWEPRLEGSTVTGAALLTAGTDARGRSG
jgi:hypothetical protein